MDQLWRVDARSPFCNSVFPAICYSASEAEYYELPAIEVAVENAQGDPRWVLRPERLVPEAAAAMEKYGRSYKSLEHGIAVAGAWLQLVLTEAGWHPFFIPRLGQRIDESVVDAIEDMDQPTRKKHIDWLIRRASIDGAYGPGLEALRAKLAAVFDRPDLYKRLPDQYDACPELWDV